MLSLCSCKKSTSKNPRDRDVVSYLECSIEGNWSHGSIDAVLR